MRSLALDPMREVARLMLALLLTLLLVTIAIAQTPTSTTPNWLADVWGIVFPIMSLLVTTIGPVVVGWLAKRLSDRLTLLDENSRKEFEARVRDALHHAALNALKYALTRTGLPVADITKPAVIAEAVDYIRSKNPDSAREAGLNNKGLEEIILSKVPDVIAILAAGAEAPAKPVAKQAR
jgi:hypothetical protein